MILEYDAMFHVLEIFDGFGLRRSSMSQLTSPGNDSVRSGASIRPRTRSQSRNSDIVASGTAGGQLSLHESDFETQESLHPDILSYVDGTCLGYFCFIQISFLGTQSQLGHPNPTSSRNLSATVPG